MSWEFTYHCAVIGQSLEGIDQNSGFIFTIDDESKGPEMKADSEFGLALGGWALCKAAIGKLL